MQLFPLILFGIATAFSPGPNNIMTSYTAFNFGFKKAIPTMLGVIIGWTLLIILLQLERSSTSHLGTASTTFPSSWSRKWTASAAYSLTSTSRSGRMASRKDVRCVSCPAGTSHCHWQREAYRAS